MTRALDVTERRRGCQEWNEQLRMWLAVMGGKGSRAGSGVVGSGMLVV